MYFRKILYAPFFVPREERRQFMTNEILSAINETVGTEVFSIWFLIGALGCFILWFGWYGFNGAAATTGDQLASIFMSTTISPAVATVVCMIFTWIRYGKPDVSMCLNASLAGLVAITAPCDVTDTTGAIIIGAVAGVLVVFGVWFCDNVAHVDDPVGAVAVHCVNGIWGTIAVGLFATSTVPESTINGLFYGGSYFCEYHCFSEIHWI